MINIALISHGCYLTGAERMLFNFALILKGTTKYNPIVYIPKGPSRSLEEVCIQNEINYRYIDEYFRYIFINDNNKQEISKRILTCIPSIKKQLINDEIELIVNNTATSIIPALLGIELEIPVIGWIHGILDSAFINTTFDNELRLFFDRILIQLSDKVLCCSNWTKNYYDKFGVDTLQVLYNWTENFEVKIDKEIETPTFACLNTFDEFKGILLLLEGAKKLCETDNDFKVLLYGDGPLRSDILKYIEENNLSDIVKIMGRTNNITDVYNSITCLIQPSFIESFGLTIIEAMAHGCPVISAKSGGPQEIILDGKTGFLIEKNNVDQLVEKMKIIKSNPHMANQMAQNGMEVYENKFSIRVASEQVLDILDKTIKEYDGISIYKQTLCDAVINILKSYSEANCLNRIDEQVRDNGKSNQDTTHRYIESDILCFSKAIKKHKKYYISCNNNELSCIGILFAGENGKPEGNIIFNIYNKSKLLRQSTLNFKDINFNEWTYFAFETILGCKGKEFCVELVFNYEDKNRYVGVYEDSRNRNFLYKAFNKLCIPLKGLNVLYIDGK